MSTQAKKLRRVRKFPIAHESLGSPFFHFITHVSSVDRDKSQSGVKGLGAIYKTNADKVFKRRPYARKSQLASHRISRVELVKIGLETGNRMREKINYKKKPRMGIQIRKEKPWRAVVIFNANYLIYLTYRMLLYRSYRSIILQDNYPSP